MVRLPEHIRDALLAREIYPTQSDGELFLQFCLQRVPATHPEAFEGRRWVDRLIIEDHIDPGVEAHRTSTFVATTDWFHTFVTEALNQLPAPQDQGALEHIQDTCFSLFTSVMQSKDSSFLTDLEQHCEAKDRAAWKLFTERPPEVLVATAKWRHWKPGRLKEESATTQRKLEQHLRQRWAERVISILAPHAKDIPHMRVLQGDNIMQEYLDLLGDTRFRTLRIHCLGLESIQRLGFTNIPWSESDVRNLLNSLRDQEITPHKLQNIWNTLKWYSSKFGLLDPDSLERLKSKRKTIQEGLVETVVKPQRKAQLPSLAVVSALERVAAGDLAVAHGTDKVTPQQLMDQYICAIARFQVACSSRFNDLQHTSPANFKVSDKSLELQAWQTKTVSAFRIKKNPVPLIAPLHSFTGKSWWKPLTTTWTRLVGHDNFKDMDYLVPTVSSDYTGFIPRPSQADRALRWLKDALHRSGLLTADQYCKLSWHSFRVFIPDCAYQLGMPRDQRQYLGNWSAENTADIYTREKRKVVHRAWTEVAERLPSLDLDSQKLVPIDLDHQDWQPKVWAVDEEGHHHTAPSSPRSKVARTSDDGESRSKQNSPGSQDSWGMVTPPKQTDDHQIPLRVICSNKPNRNTRLYSIHLVNAEGKAVGCGWQPTATKALDLNPLDYHNDQANFAKCNRCFKKHTFPDGWTTLLPVPDAPSSDDLSSGDLSSDIFSDASNDTASDEDKVAASQVINKES